MKRMLPYIFSLTMLTILGNIILLTNFVIKGYATETDFSYSVIVVLFISSILIVQCKSIYFQQVTRGDKSIKKLARLIVILSWVDLLFISFAFIEGIHAEQNPFTNSSVTSAWIVISIIVVIIYYLEKKYSRI